MTSSLYYYQPVDRAYNAAAIRQSTGVDPATYGVDGLNRLGVYPITGDTTQPFNDGLWDYAVSYTVVGQYACFLHADCAPSCNCEEECNLDQSSH